MYCYDGKNFNLFGKNEFSEWFFSMTEDKSGNLWFSNGKNGGATCFNISSGIFKNITAHEGLCNDEVWSVLNDDSGNIWFKSKDKGLCKYDGKTFVSITR